MNTRQVSGQSMVTNNILVAGPDGCYYLNQYGEHAALIAKMLICFPETKQTYCARFESVPFELHKLTFQLWTKFDEIVRKMCEEKLLEELIPQPFHKNIIDLEVK